MASGYITGTTNLYTLDCRLAWASTPNAATNTSELTLTFQLRNRTGAYISNSGTWTLQVGGNSQTIRDTATVRANSQWTDVWTRTVTVTHESDGTKSIFLKVTGGLVSGYVSTSLSGRAQLDAIVQACQFISVTDTVTFGETLTVTISKPSDTLGAVLVIALGSRSETINMDGSTVRAEWTLPEAWEDQLESGADSMRGTLTLTTYTDSGHTTQQGETQETAWTAAKDGAEPEPPYTPLPGYDFDEVSTLYNGIKAAITIVNAAGEVVEEVDIATEDIISYSVTCNIGSGTIPLGETASAKFSLELDNTEYALDYSGLSNARVHVWAYSTMEEVDPPEWRDFGVWIVSQAVSSDQSSFITISGSDAMGVSLEDEYPDSAESYPKTIISLLANVVNPRGITIGTTRFYNSDYVIETMPEWPEGVTRRAVVAYIAACAGGFARMAYDGTLQIVTNNLTAPVHTVGPEYYTEFINNGGQKIDFNALEILDEDHEAARYAIYDTIPATPTNTIQIEDNPIMDAVIVQSVVKAYDGMEYAGGALAWIGGPEIMCGDVLEITRTNPDERAEPTAHLLITDLSITFESGGFFCSCGGELPTADSDGVAGYSSTVQVFNTDGTINARAITGSVLDYRTGAISNMSGTTETITFDSPMTGIPFVMVTQNSGDTIQPAKVTSAAKTGFKIQTASAGAGYKYLAIYLSGVIADAE